MRRTLVAFVLGLIAVVTPIAAVGVSTASAATSAPAVNAIMDTSPAANWDYPQTPNGGLGTSFSIHYQIVGNGTYVNYFSRTIYNLTSVNGLIYSKMCGWSFGCAWVAHGIGIGTGVNLTINEYRGMAKGNYEFCVYVPGWAASCRTYSVE